ERRAGGVTADEQSRRMHHQIRGVCGQPPGTLHAVVEALRIRVLRSKSVVERQHARAQALRQLPGEPVVRGNAADHETAAVEEEEAGRRRARVAWDVQARAEL